MHWHSEKQNATQFSRAASTHISIIFFNYTSPPKTKLLRVQWLAPTATTPHILSLLKHAWREKKHLLEFSQRLLPGTPLGFIKIHWKSRKTQERNGYSLISDWNLSHIAMQYFHTELSFHCLINHDTNKKLLQMFTTSALKNEYFSSTLCQKGKTNKYSSLYLPCDFYATSLDTGCNTLGLFIAQVESAHYLFMFIYRKKQRVITRGILHTVVVVDFLKMVFWGFGAVCGGTVAGLGGGKLLLGLIPNAPFSRRNGGSGGGGGGRGGHWCGSCPAARAGSLCKCTSLFLML